MADSPRVSGPSSHLFYRDHVKFHFAELWGNVTPSLRLAEQVPGDPGEVGAHRRYSDVRVA